MALVSYRRVGIPIGDDDGAASEGGQDLAGDQFGPGGGEEVELRPRAQRSSRLEPFAKIPSQGSRPGLVNEDRVVPLLRQVLYEQRGLRALPGSLTPLEGY